MKIILALLMTFTSYVYFSEQNPRPMPTVLTYMIILLDILIIFQTQLEK